MDANSPLKTMMTLNEDDGAYLADKVDLNQSKSIEECWEDGLEHVRVVSRVEVKVGLNKGYENSSLPLSEANEEMAQYTSLESNLFSSPLPVTELKEDEKGTSNHAIERPRSSYVDYEKHDHDCDANVDAEDLNHHYKKFSYQGDNDHHDSTDLELYDKSIAKSSTHDDATNDNHDQVYVDPQPNRIEVNDGMNDENLNTNSDHQSQMRGGDHSSGTATPENGRMVWENSSLQSPQETRNVSLSLERRLSISAERPSSSPSMGHTSPRQVIPSPAKLDMKSSSSPKASRRRYSSSPEKHSSGHKRASSRDRSSPFKRRKSSERASKRAARYRDDSPRRRLSRSPHKHSSPRNRGRSTSKSPSGRRGSPWYERDRSRSRSRSPIGRNRSRRSPRRYSPRHRSPSYHYRQHRSSRRPWSPPTNRNTGVGRPGKNLFVAGFNFGTTEKDLERKFSRFGRVTDVRILRDRRSGNSRGFGFLALERDEDADAAIRAVDQTEWRGRILLVEKSKTS